MAHFTFSYVNPRISIYNTETNMVWNNECFSPLSASCPRRDSNFSLFEGLFHIFAYFK